MRRLSFSYVDVEVVKTEASGKVSEPVCTESLRALIVFFFFTCTESSCYSTV